ncbi:MAG: SAM-dependent DNA methyltransferase, partial [Deltaproteobacteria bacterium]|nr:SAM-dependent DNA methyltransferase [Deltaproteobacteria bacterium]
MQTLNKTLRSKLESTIKEARDLSEEAAKAVLRQLGVDKPEAPAYLDSQDLEKRSRLREHAIQIGDNLDDASEKNGRMDRLVEETAYEHWHSMLFAKFLEQNDLLMFPDPTNPVPISLAECEELAPEKGASNGWELASKYAAEMLPQIFRIDSPVFSVKFSAEFQNKLEKLIEDLPDEIYSATDSLGWVYQFWQGKRKKDVLASEVKIGERELPAVTQLFTEQYMVQFLLCNSLGAWWAGKKLSETDFKSAATEEELRNKLSLQGQTFDYLRFVRDDGGTWGPAAGTFDLWPDDFKNLKILDPCCGSGHFLVAAFLMLVPMRMDADTLTVNESVNAVISENLYGLEIDKRCVEIAVFALAMAAWKYPGAGGYRILPEMNIACSGLSIGVPYDDWISLAGRNQKQSFILEVLYNIFKDSPLLGSL